MRARLQQLRQNRLFDFVFVVVIALSLALCVQAFAVKPYKIPSASMEPTLAIGQRVLVNRIARDFGASPNVGDVIVFRPPQGAAVAGCADKQSGTGTRKPCAMSAGTRDTSTYFIKRVVAVAGDTIAIVHGHAVRNGTAADEPFARHCTPGNGCEFPEPIRVPADHVFVMGDN